MAKATGSMGITIAPEVSFARRIVYKHSLKPPVDVEHLVTIRAELLHRDIPFDGIDGISVNLKVPGKRPRVIVNSRNVQSRKRFTLAHELGHIVIPWHMGTIVDQADPAQPNSSSDYWKIEEEANAFAAEVLIPDNWIKPLLYKENHLAKLHEMIFRECDTSALAAAKRLAELLPKNIVYAAVVNGQVEFAGRTKGTFATPLSWKTNFPEDAYDYCEEHYIKKAFNRTVHWWQLPDEIKITRKDNRPWRKVLDDILHDIRRSIPDIEKKKQSINGVIAAANGVAKVTDDYSIGTVVSVCIQRFKDRAEFQSFVSHKDFEVFIIKRAEEFVNRKS